MGRREFSRLHSSPAGSGRSRRRSFFSRFELYLLVPLAVFAITLAIFSVVYILRHRGTIKPIAIAAIGVATILLVAIVVMVFRRLRRPDWLRDLESASQTPKIRQPGQLRWSRQSQLGTEGLYTVIANTQAQNASRLSFVEKVRLAVRKTINPNLLSRNSFETAPPSGYRHLGGSSDGRPSTESSEEKIEEGLWLSVFELAGDEKLDQLRRDNLKRLSRESRRSRYEMSAMEEVMSTSERMSGIQIMLTKPEPTVSPLRSGRGSSSCPRSSRELSQSVSQAQPESNKATANHDCIIPVISSPPSPLGAQFGPKPATRQARGLRRLPSPQETGGGFPDLRVAFKTGLHKAMEGN